MLTLSLYLFITSWNVFVWIHVRVRFIIVFILFHIYNLSVQCMLSCLCLYIPLSLPISVDIYSVSFYVVMIHYCVGFLQIHIRRYHGNGGNIVNFVTIIYYLNSYPTNMRVTYIWRTNYIKLFECQERIWV